MARFVGRENVRKRLAPLEGEQGRTSYANGVVRIELPGEAIVVRPPFGLAHEHEYGTVRLAPLLEALTDDHIVAALLVRLGGYAVGVFDGERLVASKVGSRFVKNRHKKGGSSANRFPPAPRGAARVCGGRGRLWVFNRLERLSDAVCDCAWSMRKERSGLGQRERDCGTLDEAVFSGCF